MKTRYQRNGPKTPKAVVRLGIVLMLLGVALYLYLTSGIGGGLGKGGSAVILLLIGLGFGIFTVGTVRYLKALEVEAKKAVESAEQEKTCAEQGERTEKQKKREELDTMHSAGLISRDEYDCARKKYEE